MILKCPFSIMGIYNFGSSGNNPNVILAGLETACRLVTFALLEDPSTSDNFSNAAFPK